MSVGAHPATPHTHSHTHDKAQAKQEKKTFNLSTTQTICLSRVYFAPCQRQIVPNVVTKKKKKKGQETRRPSPLQTASPS